MTGGIAAGVLGASLVAVCAGVIAAAVNGIGQLVRGSARGLRHMQSGYVRTYAGWILLGGVLVIVWFLK